MEISHLSVLMQVTRLIYSYFDTHSTWDDVHNLKETPQRMHHSNPVE